MCDYDYLEEKQETEKSLKHHKDEVKRLKEKLESLEKAEHLRRKNIEDKGNDDFNDDAIDQDWEEQASKMDYLDTLNDDALMLE